MYSEGLSGDASFGGAPGEHDRHSSDDERPYVSHDQGALDDEKQYVRQLITGNLCEIIIIHKSTTNNLQCAPVYSVRRTI